MRSLWNSSLRVLKLESSPQVAAQLSQLPREVTRSIRKAAEGLAELAVLAPLPREDPEQPRGPGPRLSFSVNSLLVRYTVDLGRGALRIEALEGWSEGASSPEHPDH